MLVNKLLKTKKLQTLHFKQTFQPIVWIFTEVMGSKPGYLLKSFSFYLQWRDITKDKWKIEYQNCERGFRIVCWGKIAENPEFQWMKKCTLGIALNLLVIKNLLILELRADIYSISSVMEILLVGQN